MAENNIPLKTISEVLQYSFFIPAYQRGYRWVDQQVEDLLRDVDEFIPKEIIDSNDKTWYCLQPIVVKECDDKIKEVNKLKNIWYEVIDGQQRLTTIFLVLHYLNQGYATIRRKPLFNLQYETRSDSEQFLKEKSFENNIDDSNIDYYHISKAYEAIVKWFIKKDQDFDINNFESKFLYSTKFIWYESLASDSIEIFTRINMGKIPLTNAELVKALFLNSSNFKDSDKEKIRLKQLEIASDWDKIEYALQEDAFWYFLNTEPNHLATRIEFIFDLMADKPTNADEYYTFRYFNDNFKHKTEKQIADNWQKIKKYYQSLEEWFIERTLYHKIGFLVATGTKIKDIISFKKEHSKRQFRNILDGLIGEKVKFPFDELSYKKGPVREILLLHNIQTMLNNENETNRFPFDRYKKERWDVEHITAIAADIPTNEQHQMDWLLESSKFIKDDELKSKTKKYKKEDFEQLFNMVLSHLSESKIHEDINDISNLVLLDASTNRSYKNAVFPVKRATIIQREKTGTFIPICTKNVFMKFYSDDVPQMTFWNQKDREAYAKNIEETLQSTKKMIS